MAVIRLAQVVRPAAGGIRRHVSLLVSHLDRKQFAPIVFGPSVLSFNPPLSEAERIAFAIPAVTSPLRDLRSAVRLSRLLKGRFDLVHAHGLRGALIGILAARLSRIPSLFTAHNLVEPGGAMQRLTVRFLGRQADRIIAVSHAVAETLRALGVTPTKTTVIPNGVDLAAFSRTDTPYRPAPPLEAETAAFLSECRNQGGEAPLIVGIGRLSPEKGFDVLVEAFVILVERLPAARLVLAGAGHQSLESGALARAGRSVHLAGEMGDVLPLLFAADVVAIPSRHEGQGIVALEAMAAGKPVVASRVGGLVETIVEGETGLLVPPDDPPALSQALYQLLTDRERSREMGMAGRARVVREYTLEKMIQRTTELYRQIAKPAGS